MKRFLIILVSVLLIASLVLLKILVFPVKKPVPAAAAANPAIPVEYYVARDTAVSYQIETVGNLRAREQVDIVSEISRKVIAIPMKEGATVKAGQVLFSLDGDDIRARIRKLEIALQLAEDNEKREKVLLDNGGISQERFDEISTQKKTLQAEIDVLRVDLAKTTIRAPFGGRIGIRNVSIGALVSPGTVLANLQDVSRMKLDFSIPERYALDLKPGSEVHFRTDYLPGEQVALVEAIEPSVDQLSRTLPVQAAAQNSEGLLVAGTSAKVTIAMGGTLPGLFVPTSALVPSMKGYSVFLKKNGAAVATPVKTGVRSSEFIQITEGVSRGDTLATTNLLRLRNGAPLTLSNKQ